MNKELIKEVIADLHDMADRLGVKITPQNYMVDSRLLRLEERVLNLEEERVSVGKSDEEITFDIPRNFHSCSGED